MYLALKLVHILAVIAFLGNITTGIFWKAWADSTKNIVIVAHTIRGIIRSDRLITIPGIFVIIIAGIAAAFAGGWPILGTGWILWGLIAFVLAGLAFGPVSRLQKALEALLSSGDPAVLASVEYARLSLRWQQWGTAALVLPLIAVAFMVLKPALPAFHR